MSLSALVFDCDGIIMESVDAKTQAFGQVAERFGSEIRDRLILYHRIHGGVSRQEKFRWLYREVLQRDILAEEMDILCREFSDHAYSNIINSPLVAGVMEVLEYWQGKLPMYVCSGTPQGELVEILTSRNLAKYFTEIHGTPPEKTELLRRIAAKVMAPASEILMIGDSITDETAALEVGTQFYGRGEQFAKYPWGEDLTGLQAWLLANV